MKKMIALAVTAAMTLSLVSCASTTETTPETVAGSGVYSAVVDMLTTDIHSETYTVDDQFSTKDYEVGPIADSYIEIALADGASTSTGDGVTISGDIITITQAGSYLISGVLTEGQIVVDAGEDAKVQLSLDGVTIGNSTTAAIYGLSADKMFITTESGTTNTIVATIVDSDDSNVDAAIFAKCDLTLNGEGALNVTAIGGNGITTKDDLAITSGQYTVTADGHGLEANNSIRVAGGTFAVTSGKDGYHSEHDEDATLGYIYIMTGDFTIHAQGDGIDSSASVVIQGGDFDITTADGSASVTVTSSNTMGGMGQMSGDTDQMTARDPAEIPALDESFAVDAMPDRGTMPQADGATDVDAMPEMGGMTQGTTTGGDMGTSNMGANQMGGTQMAGQSGMGGMSGGMTGMTGGNSMMGGGQTTTATTEEDTVSTKGIKGETAVSIYAGTITIDSSDDAIHSNGTVLVEGGTLTIQSGDDAIRAETTLVVCGGTVNILTCYEGLEGHNVIVSGGDTTICSNDDGINSVKSVAVTDGSDVAIYITGGTLEINSSNEGDGVDSNGNIYMSGGTVIISSTTVTTDTSLDFGSSSAITGGTFLAAGSSSQTRQNFGDDSTQCSIMLDLSTFQSGTITMTDSQGTVIAEFTPAKEYQTIHISTPDMEVGETYTIVAGTETQTVVLDTMLYSTYSGSNMGGGMSQGGMSQGGMNQGGMSGGMGGR